MNKARIVIVYLAVAIVGTAWIVWRRNENVPAKPKGQLTVAISDNSTLTNDTNSVVSKSSSTGAVPASPSASISTTAKQPLGLKFEETRHCHNLLWRRDVAGSIAACASSNDSDERAECSENERALTAKLAQIDQGLRSCSPVKADIEHAYFVETKRAAIMGDPDAQLCYLQARFNFANGLPENEEIDYKAAMSDFVNAGISRGDWRMIELMGQPSTTFHRKGPYLRRELTDGGSYVVYQMNRLLRLGADGEYAKLLDASERAVTPDLTEDEIAKANKWAKVTFDQNFENAPRLTAPPVTCDTE
jgi:hypothetical protein